MKKNLSHLFFSLIAFAVAYGLAWLTAIDLVMNAVFLSFLIQWILFVPAYYFQTEKFYDLAGSMTYLTVIIYTSYASYLMTGFNLGSMILGLYCHYLGFKTGYFLVYQNSQHRRGQKVSIDQTITNSIFHDLDFTRHVGCYLFCLCPHSDC